MPPAVRQLALDIRWHDVASLQQFVSGGNGLPLATLQALLADPPGSWLYLFGDTGTGKTHLLQAACRHLGERGLPVFYLPAAQAEIPREVLQGLDDMALVAVDDVDALAGDREAEEALFHLYNRLREAGGRLLVSSRVRPGELAMRLPDLQSRLGWGQVQGLVPLRDEELLVALQLRARQRGLELPDETARFLLTRLPRSVGALFGALDRLDRAALAAQRRLTIPFVRTTLLAPDDTD